MTSGPSYRYYFRIFWRECERIEIGFHLLSRMVPRPAIAVPATTMPARAFCYVEWLYYRFDLRLNLAGRSGRRHQDRCRRVRSSPQTRRLDLGPHPQPESPNANLRLTWFHRPMKQSSTFRCLKFPAFW